MWRTLSSEKPNDDDNYFNVLVNLKNFKVFLFIRKMLHLLRISIIIIRLKIPKMENAAAAGGLDGNEIDFFLLTYPQIMCIWNRVNVTMKYPT